MSVLQQYKCPCCDGAIEFDAKLQKMKCPYCSTEFELEILSSIEYNGNTYLAVAPAGAEEDEQVEVSILKSVDEDGESILCAIEDDQELETVEKLIMDQLYEEEDEDFEE